MATDLTRVTMLMAPNFIRAMMIDTAITFKPLVYKDIYEWKDIPYMPKHLNAPAPSSSSSSSSPPSSSSSPPSSSSVHPKHKLDIFIPSKPFPRPKQPIFIFLHGGAWTRGDKRHYANLYWNVGIAAAMNQCVGIIPSYRLTPEIAHPIHIQDIAHAVAWSIIYGSKYGGDINNIILAGHSAGGHLAMLLATEPSYLYRAFQNFLPTLSSSYLSTNPRIREILMMNSPSQLSSILRGIIGISGVYNLPRLATSPFGETLINPAFGTHSSQWKEASPVHSVGLGYDRQQILPSAPAVASLKNFKVSGLTMGKLPVLLMNASTDFHLDQDAEELDVALALAHYEYLNKKKNLPHHRTNNDRKKEEISSERETYLTKKDYNETWKPRTMVSPSSSSSSSSPNSTTPSSTVTSVPYTENPNDSTTTATRMTDTVPPLPTDGLGTGITWLPGRSSFVERCIIEGTNHLSVVSGMGQPNDPTTDAVFDFVKRIVVP